MTRASIATVCLATALLASGCKVTVIDTGAATYRSCTSDADCRDAFDTCVMVTTTDGFSGRQCTRSCVDPLDCPGNGECVAFGAGPSICYQGCVSDAICEPGWSCGNVAPSVNICLPGVPSVGTPSYGRCTATTECQDARDECVEVANSGVVGAQCTRTCVDDRDCPGIGQCVSFDGVSSYCYETCISNSSCEPNWGCNTLSDGGMICLPGDGTPVGIAPYDACTMPGQTDLCVSPTGCAGVTLADGSSGAFCTIVCNTSAMCPLDSRGDGGECIALDGFTFICYERCRNNGDCLTGWSCKPPDVGLAPVCLPT